MPGTRAASKRAAPPAADAEANTSANGTSEPAPKRAKRGAKAQATAGDNDQQDSVQTTRSSKAKKSSAKSAAKDVTADDGGEDELPAVKPKAKAKAKATSKAKSKADPTEDDDDNVAADTTAPAPKTKAKGKGKVKVKAEVEDEETAAKDDEAQADAGATNSLSVPEDDVAPKIADAQFAKGKNLQVNVDEGCHLGSYRVHVDSSNGIIYDAALNQTNAGANNNKFYKIQLLTNGNDFRTWTRWGRVGEGGQNATLGNGSLQDALVNFDKKFKDKTGLRWDDRGSDPKAKKYVFVEKSYEVDSDEDENPAKSKGPSTVSRASPPKCTLAPQVKSLMELIFNQEYFEQAMQDLNYDPKKLPLGKLSKATISRGYQALKNLSALFNDPSLAASNHDMTYNAAIEHLSNLYYSYIPHAFGRNRPPIIQSDDMLKREVDLMDSLTDLKEADQIIKAEKGDDDPVHPLDSRFKGLGMQEMTPVDANTPEFTEISQYLVKTCGSTHSMNYQVRDVFRIERHGETDRFEQSNFSKIKSDRRLLWHGSRATNYGGILSQGLRIAPPEAPVSGYMFGKGIYLADMSSKSANYCCSYISGGEALLLLCEAELGQPMQTLTNASYTAGEDAAKNGMWSTWGQGSTGPKGWKDAGCVHPSLAGVSMPDTTEAPGSTKVKGAGLYYNEFIAYDVAQVRLRYLLRVKV